MQNVSLRTNSFTGPSERPWKLAKLILGPGRSQPDRAGPSATGSAERPPEVLRPSGLGFGPGWLRLRICKPSLQSRWPGMPDRTAETTHKERTAETTTRECGRRKADPWNYCSDCFLSITVGCGTFRCVLILSRCLRRRPGAREKPSRPSLGKVSPKSRVNLGPDPRSHRLKCLVCLAWVSALFRLRLRICKPSLQSRWPGMRQRNLVQNTFPMTAVRLRLCRDRAKPLSFDS